LEKDADTLDFTRGVPVVAPEGEVGHLAHVVVDRAGGAATGVVVSRADGEWLVPIEAVASADGRRVRLHGAGGPWAPTRFRDAPTDELVVYRAAAEEETDALRLRAEELVPRKEVVQAGTVDLHTEVVPSVRTLEVPVVRERVVVEHRPIEGVCPAPGPVGEERVIVVPVHEERVYVDRVPVVREEVTVGKRAVAKTRRVQATARRERAVVEERTLPDG
jgi:uncharacterized protein (TIGR02271 family)